ncbi:MAG: glycine cleavage system protein GcvH [Micrococcales bacterium]|jgi:glycine cleavage system H protein|nr:glycine cleavage system protein GcvH [Aquiluna sp.]MBT5088996.1 glycine cleavage system protein GcvH [Micrococcales bacterium]MBT5397675.1 glycine cleavage system protein GcvH [Micrococcales bacterium]MBT5430817.1 glycine cleavage system protein GcvH [Micrococcales bacterium]MBT5848731.1 glycine cleavage system protein GcvH [Micrococcales bacterium]MBT7926180.1 glycine cleavage system protein GcvH [Micrococcales bacterium]
MANPADRKYTKEHEWVLVEGDVATVGITKYAADALGEIVYVDLPKVGSNAAHMKICGEIESTKSVGELYAPMDGEIVEVNSALDQAPDQVNDDPFGDGWLIKIRYTSLPDLLSASEYDALVGE